MEILYILANNLIKRYHHYYFITMKNLELHRFELIFRNQNVYLRIK